MTLVTVSAQHGHEWYAIEVWLKQHIGTFTLDWGYTNSGIWFRYPEDATLAKISLGLGL